MSALINFSLDVAALPKEKFVSAANGKVYINLTMSVNDETRYGNNTGIYVSQTQEEREAKKKKTYLGNGKVVWNNGTILNAVKEVQEAVQEHPAEADGLPF
jgi:mannose-1-phosphate guanylyltransferase